MAGAAGGGRPRHSVVVLGDHQPTARRPTGNRRRWWTPLTLFAVAIAAGTACGHDTHRPSAADVLPLPPGVVLVCDSGGDCGSGGDYECSRVFTVRPGSDVGAEDLVEQMKQHLRKRGWAKTTPQGLCRDGGHRCATVERFVDSLGAYGNASPALFHVPADEVAALNRDGVTVSISDCCGERWPF